MTIKPVGLDLKLKLVGDLESLNQQAYECDE